MVARPNRIVVTAILSVGVLTLVSGCAGRRVSSAVQEQSQVPGETAVIPAPVPAPAPPKVTEAPPLAPAPAPREEVRIAEPQPAPQAPLPEAPVLPPIVEAPPAPTPPAPPVAESPRPSAPAVPTPVPAVIQEAVALTDVFFDYDRFDLRPEGKSALEENAKRLKERAEVSLLIEGHCDERGTIEYNLVLGERRAQAVRRYLEDLGISPSRLKVTSFGKERPFCVDHSAECWQKNRRAHFVMR